MWPKDCPLWYTLQTISYSAEIYKYNNQKNILFQWRYQSNKKLQKYHFLSPKLRLHIFDDFIGSKILNLYCPEIFMEIYLIFINLFYFFQKWHFFILQHLGTSIFLIEKAKKAMFPLWSLLIQFKLPCLEAIKLFESLIRPIALYNAENLAHLTFREIESLRQKKISFLDYLNKSYSSVLHQRFLKYILGVNRSCTNMAILGELGEFPLQMNGIIALLSFWHRISQMPDDTLVKQAYNTSKEEENQSEWIASVKWLLKYLRKNGIPIIYPIPLKLLKNLLKKKD